MAERQIEHTLSPAEFELPTALLCSEAAASTATVGSCATTSLITGRRYAIHL